MSPSEDLVVVSKQPTALNAAMALRVREIGPAAPNSYPRQRPIRSVTAGFDLVPASSDSGPERLRIAVLAPPWISVPPNGYGGVESVVAVLADAMVRRGHEVTLFCAPGSNSKARVQTILADLHEAEMGLSIYEADHVSRALDLIEPALGGGNFDLVHDHSGFVALAMAERLKAPFVHTLHGQFDEVTSPLYLAHGHKAALVAISNAQLATAPAGVNAAAVIPNPIELSDWPFQSKKEKYVLWIGRFNEEKGPHRAIEAARIAGVPIVLAGVIQAGQREYFDRRILPHLDGDKVLFVGEVGGKAKHELFLNAMALLMPIRWEEPFGMVMIEALAAGTPVIAFAEGAVTEVVQDGITGFQVDSVEEMAEAIGRLGEISAIDCRAWVCLNCDADLVARAYEHVYRSVMTSTTARLAAAHV